jgi:hypothetical protein
MRHMGAVALLAALLTGCGASASPSPTGEVLAVHIVNVDGPDVDLFIGDHVIATLACGGTAALVPGAESLPGLPWEVTVKSSDGAILGTPSIADPLPQGLLIRGTSVLTGPWPMSHGPAPAACVGAPAT